MKPLADVFALLAAVAGWFYLFYSKAATNLTGVEAERLNRRRIRLRRMGGGVMFLLAVGFYAGFNAVNADEHPRAFVTVWMTVFVLLALLVILALVDVRLTWKLHQARNKGNLR